MPTYPKIGRFVAPQSVHQLEKFADGWNSQEAGFLLPFARRNFLYCEYDFPTTQTMTTELTAAGGGGAANSAYAILATQIENGAIRGTTGTGTRTTSIVQIKQNALIFDAARNPGMEVRHKFSAITDISYEMAFAGPAPGTEALHNISALSAAGVPTIVANTISDQAGVALDTGLTLATAALYTKGTTDAATGTPLGTKAPTAAVYQVVRLQLRANGSYACIDDDLSADGGLNSGCDTGILLRPHILASNAGGSGSRTHDVDYWRIWAERN